MFMTVGRHSKKKSANIGAFGHAKGRIGRQGRRTRYGYRVGQTKLSERLSEYRGNNWSGDREKAESFRLGSQIPGPLGSLEKKKSNSRGKC